MKLKQKLDDKKPFVSKRSAFQQSSLIPKSILITKSDDEDEFNFKDDLSQLSDKNYLNPVNKNMSRRKQSQNSLMHSD